MRNFLNKFLEGCATLLFSSMIIFATWQVLSRYIFKNPSTITEEFLRFALIWVSMLGIAYVSGLSSHVSIDFLNKHLSYIEQKKLAILVQVIFMIFAVVIMIIGGYLSVSISTTQISPALKIPMSLIYISMPVSGVFTLIYSILNINDLSKEIQKELNL